MIPLVASPERVDLQADDLPSYRQWRAANGDDLTILDFLAATVTAEIAIACTKLFWPDLIEHAGGVFLADGFAESVFDQWAAVLNGDIGAIERVMNHRHLTDLLAHDEVPPAGLAYLGRTLAEMWAARLERRFPEHRFAVRCDLDEVSGEVELTFSRVR